jgi:hypothetical protein
MGARLTLFAAAVAILCLVSGRGVAEEGRLEQLERRVQHLEQSAKQGVGLGVYALSGFFLLLIGTFSALWARGSGRDPWLWLVAGLLFNVFVFVGVLIAVFFGWLASLPGSPRSTIVRNDLAGEETEGTREKVSKPAIQADRPRNNRPSSHNITPA